MNERMEVPLEFVSYQKYLWDLISAVNCRDIQHEIIGEEASERTGIRYPLLRLSVNPGAARKICVISGIHGNEIAGPLSLLSLFSKDFFCELPDCFHYVIYPMVNPTGFDLRQRFDDDYRDLNAVFQTTLTSDNYLENQRVIADALGYGSFDAVITLHEDSDVEQFYMYGLGAHNMPIYHAMCQYARIFCEPWANANIYGCESDEHGFILSTPRDFAFDGYFYTKGLAPIACTFETPGKLNIDFRIHMMLNVLLFFFGHLA
jgi:hypothetical protein